MQLLFQCSYGQKRAVQIKISRWKKFEKCASQTKPACLLGCCYCYGRPKDTARHGRGPAQCELDTDPARRPRPPAMSGAGGSGEATATATKRRRLELHGGVSEALEPPPPPPSLDDSFSMEDLPEANPYSSLRLRWVGLEGRRRVHQSSWSSK